MNREEQNEYVPGVFKVGTPIIKKSNSTFLRIVVWVLFLALLGSLGGGYYLYRHAHDTLGAGSKAKLDVSAVVATIGAHIILPEGVTPKIGRISNTEEFKLDPFLSQALLDDVVLFYPYHERTVKAILWRPSLGKIVDVSLVTLPKPL